MLERQLTDVQNSFQIAVFTPLNCAINYKITQDIFKFFTWVSFNQSKEAMGFIGRGNIYLLNARSLFNLY